MSDGKSGGVLVTGASGIIGHALCEELTAQGYAPVWHPAHKELDLLEAPTVDAWLREHRPATVIHCAALSGSTDVMRDRAADILAGNILMQTHVLSAAAQYAEKVIYVGSGSVYGPSVEAPFREEQAVYSIQSGALEGYAVSKIAGLSLCRQYQRGTHKPFIGVLPTHIYGCHSIARMKEAVIDSLVLRLLEAKRQALPEITLDIWGTGKLCKRQYMHVRDCAKAIIHILEHYSGEEPVNLATKEIVSLDEVVQITQRYVQYGGAIHYLADRKEVASSRLMCVDRLEDLGFVPSYTLEAGLKQLVDSYSEMMVKQDG